MKKSRRLITCVNCVEEIDAHEDMLSALKELKAVLELSEATVVFGAQYKVVCDAIAKAEGL